MIYDTSKPNELKELEARKEYLVSRGAVIELKEKREQRSIPHNAYFHVVCSLLGLHTGYELEEIKKLLKEHFGYTYEKNGKVFLKSTAKMDDKELAEFIEKIRNLSSKYYGYEIPDANEYKLNRYAIDREIEKHKLYL